MCKSWFIVVLFILFVDQLLCDKIYYTDDDGNIDLNQPTTTDQGKIF